MKARILNLLTALFALIAVGCSSHSSTSSGRADLESKSRAALDHLYSTTPGAAALGQRAPGILVFPSILEGGFIFGGQYGEGVLFENGQVTGFYNSAAASFGLQAGVDKFGYAMFFMSAKDLDYLHKSDGWEVGVGPNVTLVDEGVAASFSSSTAKKGIYAFFFQQRGLLAGVTIKGAKISRSRE
jgi:lipid-binding SYLF domain-containing protein